MTKKRGITVKIEGNEWLREGLTEDYSKMNLCQTGGVKERSARCCGDSQHTDKFLILTLNCSSNLATSLFTLGIKLKNRASNFIPGFLLLYSQSDIYSLVCSPFSLPPPLSLSILTDNKQQQGWLKAENDANVSQNQKYGISH